MSQANTEDVNKMINISVKDLHLLQHFSGRPEWSHFHRIRWGGGVNGCCMLFKNVIYHELTFDTRS